MPIYLTAQLQYYEADTPNSSSDCTIPYPSPSLVALIESGKPNPVSQSDVQSWVNTNGNGFGATAAAMMLLVALAPLVS